MKSNSNPTESAIVPPTAAELEAAKVAADYEAFGAYNIAVREARREYYLAHPNPKLRNE